MNSPIDSNDVKTVDTKRYRIVVKPKEEGPPGIEIYFKSKDAFGHTYFAGFSEGYRPGMDSGLEIVRDLIEEIELLKG